MAKFRLNSDLFLESIRRLKVLTASIFLVCCFGFSDNLITAEDLTVPSGIRWRDWSSETFAEAKKFDRPVLLYIGASWSHWCHIMDMKVFSDPQVIRLVNGGLIPIKVDSDRRPDINERYNMGGWPTIAFLTPSGQVIQGKTFTIREEMIPILRVIGTYYRERKREIEGQYELGKEYQKKQETEVAERKKLEIDKNTAKWALRVIRQSYDPRFKGFGGEPKFPQPETIELVLQQYYKSKRLDLLNIALETLDKMRQGIYDKVSGGFFRYSLSVDWREPSFEKTLDVNAAMLGNYLQAYQITGDKKYLETAEGVMGYVQNVLLDKQNGVFYASQDSDFGNYKNPEKFTEGEEYYKLNAKERATLGQPNIDKTFFTDWNALMVSSYLKAYEVTSEESYKDIAIKALDWLLNKNFSEKEGMYHYFDGEPRGPVILTDQARMVSSLLYAYQITDSTYYLSCAEKLTELTQQNFGVPFEGGFYDIVEKAGAVGALSTPLKPIETNSIFARSLIKLYYLTEKVKYKTLAEKTIASFGWDYTDFGLFSSEYAIAVEELLNEPIRVIIVGQKEDKRSQELLKGGLKSYRPNKIVQILDPEQDKVLLEKRGYSPSNEPVAYVCVEKICSVPIKDPTELTHTVKHFEEK